MVGNQRPGRLRLLHNYGLNTRRYHGLLVAATRPSVGRMVLLSKVEETLLLDGRPVELSANPRRRQRGAAADRNTRPLPVFRMAGMTARKR